MDKEASLGAIVRDRRLALGYSLGQLATKVNKTAASIRAWEKGDAIPDEVEAIAVAGALDLDPKTLLDFVPGVIENPLPATPGPVVNPWVAPSRRSTSKESPAKSVETDETSPADGQELSAEMGVDTAEAPDMVAPAEPPTESVPPAPAESPNAAAIHEAPTEAVPVVPAVAVAVATKDTALQTELDAATAEPFAFQRSDNPIIRAWDDLLAWYRQVFHPDRKWIYRVRWVLLVIALYVMLRVLGWAASNLWDAVQEVLDSVSFTPTETPDVAN